MISRSEAKIKKALSNISQKHLKPNSSIPPAFKIKKESNEKEIINEKNNSKSNSNNFIYKEENSEIKSFNFLFLQNNSSIIANNKGDSGEKYNQASNVECNKSNCFYPNYCSDENKICVCGLAFAEYSLYQLKDFNKNKNYFNINSTNISSNSIIKTDSEETEKIIYCAYERKRQTVYFLLEFLLNIGAGHFYSNNYLLAALKFGLVFFPWTFICVTILASIAGSVTFKDIRGFATCLAFMFICLSGIWWITDAILIGMKFFPDGNGVPLLTW